MPRADKTSFVLSDFIVVSSVFSTAPHFDASAVHEDGSYPTGLHNSVLEFEKIDLNFTDEFIRYGVPPSCRCVTRGRFTLLSRWGENAP